MAALEQYGTRSLIEQRVRCPIQIVFAQQWVSDQQRGLIQVGCDQRDPRKQFAHQHLHGGLVDQHGATGGHHDRAEHHLCQAVPVDGLGHGAHDVRCVQHADLHRVHTDVVDHRVDLVAQQLHRQVMDGAHAQRVLCRDSRHAETAQCRERLQVGLDTGAATAVRARNRQHPRIAKTHGLSVHRTDSAGVPRPTGGRARHRPR